MKARYIGMFDEVEVPALNVFVERGDEIEFALETDEDRALAYGLLCQTANWEPLDKEAKALRAAYDESERQLKEARERAAAAAEDDAPPARVKVTKKPAAVAATEEPK